MNLKSILIASVIVLSASAFAEGQQSPGLWKNNGNGQGARIANNTDRRRGPAQLQEKGPALSQQTFYDLDQIEKSDLSPREAEDLMFMFEEEKLARDVYNELYETWKLPIFANIAKSEQQHMDAVSFLLERYEIGQQVESAAGQFSSPEMNSLYSRLIRQGEESLVSALQTGAAIEDLDISDLETRIANTDNEDIIAAYQNLLKGSGNHLRSFVSQLERNGSAFEAQYSDEKTIENILSGTRERGPSSR